MQKLILCWLCFAIILNALESNARGNQQPPINYPLALEKCLPTFGMTKQMCDRLISDGCSELLAWVGVGCVDAKGKRYRDGGCQSLADGVYCDWQCKTRCVESGQCIWANNECRYRGCGGIDVFDYSPPDHAKSVADFASLRAHNWALDGIGVAIPLSQNRFCGVQLYMIASREPDPMELGVLEMRLFLERPTSFNKSPVSVTQFTLVKALARGRLAESALNWYSLRYEITENRIIPMIADRFHVVFRFPQWKQYAFSFLSASEISSNKEYDISCPYSIGNITTQPQDTCNSYQRNNKLFVKIFA
jgi:hypothetical protein